MRRFILAASAALVLGTQEARAQSIGKMLGDDFKTGGSFYVGKNVVPPILGVYVLGVAFKNQGMRDFVTAA